MKNKLKKYKQYFINLLKLAAPIFGGNISQILIGLCDTIVAGRYSTQALGAISVASAIVMTVTIGAIGLILSISPVIANLRGKKQPAKKYFKLTILFSIIVAIPFYLILELFLYKLKFVGLSPEIVQGVETYIKICAITVFPTVIFVCLKEFLQAYEKVLFANLLMFFMVFLNLILNLVLTFGINYNGFYIPEMGVKGLSIATLTSKTVSCIFMILYCLPLFKGKFVNSKQYVKNLLKVGFPISAAVFFEFLGFNLTALIIGKFSGLFAGVHNIILCLSNFTFMIVLSIANAVSIKVGYFNGRKDILNIKRYALTSIYMTFLICLTTFIILSNFWDNIIKIFSNDPMVLSLSKEMMIFVMAFLFFDGLQGTNVGILKGLKDTKIIMITMLFAYLVIAIPIGCFLAFKHNIVLKGFWFGLTLAIFFTAIVTSIRVLYNIKRLQRDFKTQN